MAGAADGKVLLRSRVHGPFFGGCDRERAVCSLFAWALLANADELQVKECVCEGRAFAGELGV